MAFLTVQVVGALVVLAAATSVACVTPDAVPGGGGSSGDPTGNGGAGGSTGTGGDTAGVDFAWAHGYGVDDSDDDHARSIGPAANGGALVAGSFSGSLQIGVELELPSTIARDGFVIEHDAEGKPTWAKGFAGYGDQLVFGAAATLDDDSIVVAGSFTSTLVFDGTDHGNEPEGEDGFVARFDKERALEWLVLLDGPGDQAVHGLALTPAGNIVIAGRFSEKLALGDVPAVESGAGSDFFVARLDGSGKGLWATSLGGDPAAGLDLGEPTCYLALSGDETIHLAGSFTGSLRFDETLFSAGTRDVFVGTLNAADGKPGWGHAIGVLDQEQRAAGLAVDGDGRVILAGDLVGTAKLGAGPDLVSIGSEPDAFLAVYDKTGAPLWSQRYGSLAEDHAGAVAFDPLGNILFTGRFRGTISFPAPLSNEEEPLQNPGAVSAHDDIFLAKLDPTGKPLFSKAFGRSDHQIPTAIASGPDGELLLAGYFRGMVDFGGGELDAANGDDIFVARFGK